MRTSDGSAVTAPLTSAARLRAARTATLIAAVGLFSYWMFVHVSADRAWFAFDERSVAPIFIGLILLNLTLAATARIWATRRAVFWMYEVGHAVALTGLLHALGGVPMGMLFAGHMLMVVHAEILRPDASVFVTANLCFFAYAALATLEGLRWFPPPPVVSPLDDGQYVASVISAFLTLNLLALYANRYAYQLRGLATHLQEKVAERTAALTVANAELARAYEELRTAEADLLDTEKRASLAVLVSGVAHEINNPVSFIVGNIAPLRSSLAKLHNLVQRLHDNELAAITSRISRMVDTIARGAERTAAIVADLRVFSRTGDLCSEPFDVHDGIELALRLLQPRWTGRVAVHRDFDVAGCIEAAPGQINQVLMNILANACDAIGTSGNIWITTRHHDRHFAVSVRDDGPGIAPEHLPRIFDPFFTTKPVGRGTGLGLAISQSIVSAHGGRILVSTKLGSGTTFTLILPRDARTKDATLGARDLERTARGVSCTNGM